MLSSEDVYSSGLNLVTGSIEISKFLNVLQYNMLQKCMQFQKWMITDQTEMFL